MGYLRRIVSDARPRPSAPALPIAASAAPAAATFALPSAAAPGAVDRSEPPGAGVARAPQPVQRRRRRLAPDETVVTTPQPQPAAPAGLEAAGIDRARPAGDAPAAVPSAPRPPQASPQSATPSPLRMPRADESESNAPGGPMPERAAPPQRASSPPQVEQAAARVGSEPPTVARADVPATRAGSDGTLPSPRARARREAAPPSPTAPAESFSPQPERAAVASDQTARLTPQPQVATPMPALARLAREPAQTQVRIGQVDVFVRDPAPPRSAAPPRPTATTSASRRHLRRL